MRCIFRNGVLLSKAEINLHNRISARDVAKFMREIGVINIKVKTAIIIGGGRISFYLAKQLLKAVYGLKL